LELAELSRRFNRLELPCPARVRKPVYCKKNGEKINQKKGKKKETENRLF